MRLTVVAQQYPVTASTQIIPPYSVYLPDYVVPGSDKMRVILVQNDLTRPSYDVILKMTIEQNGVVIMRSSTRFMPRPLTLSAGVPTIISGVDLMDYLNSDNIDFTGGFNRDAYEKNKSLPEGAYRITFTAYDYRRPTIQVSNPGANVFYFRKNDPPLLNLPVCGSRVEKKDPQFLNFSWSSRTSPSPVEGSVTEYIFSLYEIKPKGSNADYIIRSARPIYTVTTENTNIVYGPGEPALTDSMEYAWIIQARDKSGRDAFSNQGLSLSCKFLYQGNNPFEAYSIAKPVLYGKSTGERNIRLSWPLAAGTERYNVDAYRVEYRAADKDGVTYDWYSSETPTDTVLALNSLEPGRTYEARLQWRVAGVYGPFSDIVKVTTDPLKTFNCGEMSGLQVPENTKPAAILLPGMIVRVGHFDVLLTSVKGSMGTFTGNGRIITPGFGIGLLVEFTDITINSDLKVIRGEMQAATKGIDKFVEDAVKEQRGGNDVGKVKTGDIVPDITTNLHIFTKENITVDTDAGTITLTDSQTGKQEVIDYKAKGKDLPMVIEDADGNLYNVDKKGNVTAAGKRDKGLAGNAAALAALNTLDLDKGTVTFAPGKDNKYAFDSWKGSYSGKKVLEDSYEKLAGGKYRVSAKAIVPGETEDILATLSNAAADTNPDSIRFVNGKGIVLPFKRNGNDYTVTVTGGPGGDAQEVFAVCRNGGKYASLGKLLVASYTPMQEKLVLVQVGENTVIPEEAIRQRLSETYGKIGVTYTVEIDTTFRRDKSWDLNKDGLLQDTKSGFLGNGFTGEEKAMKKAYSKRHDIDDDATYLFVVNEVVMNNADLLGKMPRQSQFGFVFVKSASAADVGRSVAHEIGHGAYTLEHTFDPGIGIAQRTTDNLMDYKGGIDLVKYQWDIVYDPGHVWGLFESDAANDLVGYSDIKVFKELINKTNNTYTFITPGGTCLTLPESATNLKFSTLDRVYYNNSKGEPDVNTPAEQLVPLGALISFQLDNNNYSAAFIGTDFKGYKAGEALYEDKYSADLKPKTGIAAFLGIKDSKFVTYASRFEIGQKTDNLSAPYYGTAVSSNEFAVVPLNMANADPFEKVLNAAKNGNFPLLTLEAKDLQFATENVKLSLGDGNVSSVKDFLLQSLSAYSPVKDYFTFYALANLKPEDLEAYKTCMTSVGWNDVLLNALRKIVYDEGMGHNAPVYQLYHAVRKQTLDAVKKLSAGSDKMVKDLEELVRLGKDISVMYNDVFEKNYSYCALGTLSRDARMNILQQLFKEGKDYSYWYTSNKDFIILDLIRSTPQVDRLTVLKDGFMANNYQWLRKLLFPAKGSMESDKIKVSYSDLKGVANVISSWFGDTYANLGVPVTKKTFGGGILSIPEQTIFPGERNYYLGLNENGYVIQDPQKQKKALITRDIHFTGNDLGGFVSMEENGKISMSQTYKVKYMPKEGSDYEEVYDIYNENYDPFEPVTLLASRNLHEIGLDIDQKVIVPAFMAYFYHKDVEDTETAENDKKKWTYLNIGFGVVAAFETGGSSLAVALQFTQQVSSALSAGDIWVQQFKKDLNNETYQKNKAFFQSWDRIVTSAEIANMAVGGVAITSAIRNKLGSLIAAIEAERVTLEKTPVILTMIKKAWDLLKNARNAESTAASIITSTEDLKKVSVIIPGENLKNVNAWLKPKNDVIFVVVHGDNTGFKVVQNGVEETLEGKSLMVEILKHATPESKVVLLSCSDINVAKKFSKEFELKLGANHGYVEIADNGAIAGEYPFVEISPDGTTREVSISEFAEEASMAEAKAAGREVVRLGGAGEGASAGGEIDWAAVKSRFAEIAGKNTQIQAKFNKLLRRMEQYPKTASRFAEHIVKGTGKGVQNYRIVLTNATPDEHSMKASIQALDIAEELLSKNYTEADLMFEHKSDIFDVDLGIREMPGLERYKIGYQFKTNKEQLTKATIKGACRQLERAPVEYRIPELALVEKDNLADIVKDPEITAALKNYLYENQFKDEHYRTIMNEIRLVFSNGERVKVMYADGMLKYIKY